ncbi:MAG: peptidylprolyl isomerase [Gemmatimonadaceae bacterium]
MPALRGWALVAGLLMLAVPRPASAQADTALARRILSAELRRDSTAPALAEGAGHHDPRVRALALRARERIVDPHFSRRDSLPGAELPPPPEWPEPEWKSRYRALMAQRDDCQALTTAATADPVWPVRLRVAALARASCAGHGPLVATFRAWATSLPADASHRARDGVSWQGGAQGLVALARLRPAEASDLIAAHRLHPQWQVRQYAARAAALASDTAALRALARDPDDNVKEAAIEGLARLTGHADDSLFVAALGSEGAQAVLAAAVALGGSAYSGARKAALAAFARFVTHATASERDVRLALLEAAGRPPTDDQPPAPDHTLPRDAVALALGATSHLCVTMASASGGGGQFVVRLRGDVAPLMAARILDLVRAGHYDGLTWHRVEHDFVIQGGSPGANEYVGLDRYLVDELGTLPHRRGTVGMSTRGHDTGDAQWFVNLRDNLRLGRDYTVFAEVVEGIEVVDAVMEGDVIESIVIRPSPP